MPGAGVVVTVGHMGSGLKVKLLAPLFGGGVMLVC